MGPCLSSSKTVDDESKQAKETSATFFNKLVENDPTSFNLCKLEPIPDDKLLGSSIQHISDPKIVSNVTYLNLGTYTLYKRTKWTHK